jgi:hypothetical protein
MIGTSLSGYVRTWMFIWRDFVGEGNRKVGEADNREYVLPICRRFTVMGRNYLGKRVVAPLLDLILPHGTFQEERIGLGEGLGRGSAAK